MLRFAQQITSAISLIKNDVRQSNWFPEPGIFYECTTTIAIRYAIKPVVYTTAMLTILQETIFFNVLHSVISMIVFLVAGG